MKAKHMLLTYDTSSEHLSVTAVCSNLVSQERKYQKERTQGKTGCSQSQPAMLLFIKHILL
jgi:hypothetical protein